MADVQTCQPGTHQCHCSLQSPLHTGLALPHAAILGIIFSFLGTWGDFDMRNLHLLQR